MTTFREDFEYKVNLICDLSPGTLPGEWGD